MTENDVRDMLDAAQNGQHVAVICNARWDAEQRGRAIYDALAKDGERQRANAFSWAQHIRTIRHQSGGAIEFVWIESHSGRRTSDYDRVSFAAAR